MIIGQSCSEEQKKGRMTRWDCAREGGGVEECVVVGLALLLVQRLAELHLHSPRRILVRACSVHFEPTTHSTVHSLDHFEKHLSKPKMMRAVRWPPKLSEDFESNGERPVHLPRRWCPRSRRPGSQTPGAGPRPTVPPPLAYTPCGARG